MAGYTLKDRISRAIYGIQDAILWTKQRKRFCRVHVSRVGEDTDKESNGQNSQHQETTKISMARQVDSIFPANKAGGYNRR